MGDAGDGGRAADHDAGTTVDAMKGCIADKQTSCGDGDIACGTF